MESEQRSGPRRLLKVPLAPPGGKELGVRNNQQLSALIEAISENKLDGIQWRQYEVFGIDFYLLINFFFGGGGFGSYSLLFLKVELRKIRRVASCPVHRRLHVRPPTGL